MLNSHKSLLSRYTSGYICDNNKHRICSKVNIDKNITLFNSWEHLYGIFYALVDSSQPVITMLFESSGSLVFDKNEFLLSCWGQSCRWMTTYHYKVYWRVFDCLLDVCPWIVMRLLLVTCHLDQDVSLILYTYVYIFKVTFNQESWQYVP